MPPEYAIEVEDLRRSFRSRQGGMINALDGISFRVKRGEIFGLLGPNGAGKSTTVRILSTILRPTSGIAQILGRNVVIEPLQVRRQIAVVLQETAVESLLSVRDNLNIYAQLHGFRGTEAARRRNSVLERFGLMEKQHEKAQDLSLGMRRRLQVAKAFMTDAPILFLDEATTGMDPIIKRQTLQAIRDMASGGRTIFLTTQLLEEAEALCDHLVILNRGREVASGDLQGLRALARRHFHVNVTFQEELPGAFAALEALQPAGLSRNGRTAELSFEGEEAGILQGLAALASTWQIERLEIRGADLEDIFLDLVMESEKS